MSCAGGSRTVGETGADTLPIWLVAKRGQQAARPKEGISFSIYGAYSVQRTNEGNPALLRGLETAN